MRIALLMLIALHGLIHLFGFLKAFGLSEFSAITQPVSRADGIIWLVTFILFAITAALLITQSAYWWIFAFAGAVFSQILIINYWSDAKFGTILNVIILVSVLLAFSAYRFTKKVNKEIALMSSVTERTNDSVVPSQMVTNLPRPVEKWLSGCGIVGKDVINNVYLEQDLQMLMSPEQKEWSPAKARQYFTAEPPAFNWSVKMKMKPGLKITGRDKYVKGKGEMTIKAFSLIPIANARGAQKVDQATLQRYLAETVWFPSSALSPYITWEGIDDHTARATMEHEGTKGSGIFHFDENGRFKEFVAMRYKDASDAEPTEWTVTATRTEKLNGIEIPVECEAKWKMEDGNWTWLKLKLKRVDYNVENMPITEDGWRY